MRFQQDNRFFPIRKQLVMATYSCSLHTYTFPLLFQPVREQSHHSRLMFDIFLMQLCIRIVICMFNRIHGANIFFRLILYGTSFSNVHHHDFYPFTNSNFIFLQSYTCPSVQFIVFVEKSRVERKISSLLSIKKNKKLKISN